MSGPSPLSVATALSFPTPGEAASSSSLIDGGRLSLHPPHDGVRIIYGNANKKLAQDVAKYFGPNALAECKVNRFADGEVSVSITESVRGYDVFVIQPTAPPVNDNLMEILLIFDALRRASAKRITAVIPYYGYARQDRKTQSRVPISAALVAQLIETAGAHRVLAIDLHCGQIQGFFRIPVDNLYAAPVLADHFKKVELVKPVVVSPDAGGAERADKFREIMEAAGIRAGMAIMNKHRSEANKVASMELVGSVEGSDCIIVDDMIDTAGTLVKAADVLKENGARRVFACISHALLNGPARSRIRDSQLEQLIVSDTIFHNLEDPSEGGRIVTMTIAPLLAEAIRRIHGEQSITTMFNQ